MKIWRKRLTELMNQLMNDEAVYGTAPATPGLLNILYYYGTSTKVNFTYSWFLCRKTVQKCNICILITKTPTMGKEKFLKFHSELKLWKLLYRFGSGPPGWILSLLGSLVGSLILCWCLRNLATPVFYWAPGGERSEKTIIVYLSNFPCRPFSIEP